jgi:hypothetical protein
MPRELKVLSVDWHKHIFPTIKGRTSAGEIITIPVANILHFGPPRIGEWVMFIEPSADTPYR